MIYAGERVAPRMMGMAVSPWSPRFRLDCPPEVFSGESPAPVSGEALAMSSQCLPLPQYCLSWKPSLAAQCSIPNWERKWEPQPLLAHTTSHQKGLGWPWRISTAEASSVRVYYPDMYSRDLGISEPGLLFFPIKLYFIYSNREGFFFFLRNKSKSVCSIPFLKFLS